MIKPILAIDTSCDDTSAAVVLNRTILSNIVASQAELHKQFGGVFPTVAKQAHRENIEPTVLLALQRAHLSFDELAAVAVTQGPGLAPALEIGIDYAKKISQAHHLPLIPVNHIEGHALSVLAKPNTQQKNIVFLQDQMRFPVLSIIVSGGHTEFVLIHELGNYERVGWTVDDAAGEALDKFGRMVQLGYPAGPVVEQFAMVGNPKAYPFPVPMMSSGNFLMSFSGLKTAARIQVETLIAVNTLTSQQVCDLCASFQYAVFHAICYKLNKFTQKYVALHGPDSLFGVWLGGGVASNITLRKMLRKTLRPYKLELSVPYTKRLCSDNAAMIGVAASYRYKQKNDSDFLNFEFDRMPNLQIGNTVFNNLSRIY